MTFTKAVAGVLTIAALVAASATAEAARKKSTQAQTIGEALHSARVERGLVCKKNRIKKKKKAKKQT